MHQERTGIFCTMSYWRKNGKYYLFCLLLFLSFNFYFIFLMRDKNVQYLYYLDILLFLPGMIFAGMDFYRFRKRKAEKERLMCGKDIICEYLTDFENRDIALHDVYILQEKVQEQFQENCELQDYVAKWCHEFKIPLSASLLVAEKIEEERLKKLMREQLEKMNQQIQSMMLGCKLQSSLLDLQIKKTRLADCVKASIRNNQFFLIQKNFSLDVQTGEASVYTDPEWLIYILDQLIGNALKYADKMPVIRIWTEEKEQKTLLFVEDSGEGIKDSDIGRIFEKGFTGSNHHNGKYKSTGMGLYMAAKIIDRLGHQIHVESEYGVYTRFSIVFKDNLYFQL